ncbi:MAG: pitrilysin family protein [Ignavibacteria bacterium]
MTRFNSSTGSALTKLTEKVSKGRINFKEFDLPNKLHCILHQDNRNPIVNLTIGYKVGSKDEEKNKRGIAHLFEHLMFQGSENVKKNEHFGHIMKCGGNSNAFTMQDVTIYFDSMPSNNLEMALWLESDRMNSLDLTSSNLENQKSVVIEEKMQRYDNAPYGTMFHNICENIFRGSNYEFSVIGETDDINSFSVKEAVDFHSNYYSPDNSVLIITGDIDLEKTGELIHKYFADINKQNLLERKENIITGFKKETELVIHDNVSLPMLCLCYQLPKAGSDEGYPIEYFIEMIANNKSSRLYKKLVYEKKMVKSVHASKYMLEDGGVLFFRVIINPGISVDDVKSEISHALEDFATNGCSDEEFQTIKNQLQFMNTIKNLKMINISIETAFNYLYFRDISRINTEIEKYLKVSKQDVTDSVNNFIVNSKKLTLIYLPMNQ